MGVTAAILLESDPIPGSIPIKFSCHINNNICIRCVIFDRGGGVARTPAAVADKPEDGEP